MSRLIKDSLLKAKELLLTKRVLLFFKTCDFKIQFDFSFFLKLILTRNVWNDLIVVLFLLLLEWWYREKKGMREITAQQLIERP